MKKLVKILCVILGVGLIAVSCTTTNSQSAQQAPQTFKVTHLKKKDVNIFNEYAANIEGIQNIDIRPKVDGFIKEIFIDEGSQVKKGQKLFRLEAEELNQQVKAAQANVELAMAQMEAAQVEVDKLRPLVDKQIVGEIQLRSAISNYNAAKAQWNATKATYQNAKENLAYTVITSPVDGIVGSLPYRVGSLVGRNEPQPLTTISNISDIYAYFSLNEKKFLDFNRQNSGATIQDKINQMADVELILADGNSYEHEGRVEAILGMVNPRTGSVNYRVKFPNPEMLLRSGISGKIRLSTQIKDALLVPQNSTFEIQGQRFVYTVDEKNTVKSKSINIVKAYNDYFIIDGGFEKQETIVANGLINLREGMVINPELADVGVATDNSKELSAK
ncbi:efflux RND transporter periplasmic adaptor subunit [Puteibacter caeruleilacunae]|nr:efflux RND transporter periplasmic adaptor subunit [Puteibacter caeruleilacunae]